ncbi:NACHT domain-containing protein [Pseudanabaena minima]|uniref:NACHT domain-containing protein n=1 Tax=Pseudanabaena minima TaxID=890415 RepID=UPI003DA7CB7D
MSKGAWQRLCEILTTDIPISEFTQGTVDTGKTFIELAKSINENRSLSELAPLIGQVSSVLDVLNLPIVQVVGSALPLVGIASKLLQFSLDRAKVELSFADCVELVGQEAYLESFKNFLNRDENQQLLKKLEDAKASDRLQKKIAELGRSLSLNDNEACEVLDCFHESKLAKAMNPILAERLIESGMGESAAKIVVERVSRLTHRETKFVLTKLKDKVESLRAVYGGDWQSDSKTYLSIDRYLEDFIAKQPSESVFDDNFGFKDIYVELKIAEIAKDGSNSEPQFIEEWALGLLNDESKSGQVLFIQGEPARGKSVFCRMFVDRVRRELYPIWIPILIRLRDITDSVDHFDTFLSYAVKRTFTIGEEWLNNPNTRFLFVLDGFDELLLERIRDLKLKDFLDLVSEFQTKCQENSERGHRVIITGRPLALFGIEKDMPDNLERVKILDMSAELQEKWLQKWAKLKGADKAQEFKDFLSDLNCPEQVKTLAKEPMLMYFLAAMHTDGNLKIENFQNAGNSTKILIYEQTLDWVLDKQRSKGRKNLNQDLTKLDKEELRYILKEAGLCVVQSGGIFTTLDAIKDRLELDLVTKLKAHAEHEEGNLPIALATFYLKSSDTKDNSMEFLHKSFGEFLCAERFVDNLMKWSQQKPDLSNPHLQVWKVDKKDLEWQVYDLFGFGALTSEIVEYLTALIKKEFKDKDDDFVRLFERLYGFYWAWSNGEFIDAVDSDGEPIPLKKARLMQKQCFPIGQRKVDVYTGLNVLILMFTFHRYAQVKSELKDKVSFHPCKYSSKDGATDDSTRLLRIIGYGQCLRNGGFKDIVSKFLTNVNFSSTDLRGANLRGANLRGAVLFLVYLSGADLGSADLGGANLRGAMLRGTDLRGAFLDGANLRGTYFGGADLRGADLRDANLSGAYLGGADLSGADLGGADLRDISSNESKIWSNARGLHKAINVSDALASNPQFRAAVLLCNGSDLVVSGDVDSAIAAYTEAQTIDPNLEISAFYWNQLGWFGSLHNRANDVLFACDKLVELGDSADTRGLARALTGNLTGAIEDFEAAINSGELEEEILEKRQRWLEVLKSGLNPFTPEELEALRTSEGATS